MAKLLDVNPGSSTIDIGGLTFIGAAGLTCLLDFAGQLTARGATTSVVGATPRLRRVFRIVGLTHLLEAS